MHGVKKEKLDEVKKAALQKKIGLYRTLIDAALDMHAAERYDRAAADLTGKVLEMNPDFYTLWNHRRAMVCRAVAADVARRATACPADVGPVDHAVTAGLPHAVVATRPDLVRWFRTAGADLAGATASAAAHDGLRQILAEELDLSQRGIGRNPKSYCAWHHRQWVTALLRGVTDWPTELGLCTKFLKLDARNFHAWGYRRYVVDSAGVALADEFAYTTAKIKENFSNYSAWHYRSALFRDIHAAADGAAIAASLHQDFELVQQAFFTEPDDQSAWLYHRWLLGRATSLGGLSGRLADFLTAELATCNELLDEEPESKWTLLTTVFILSALAPAGWQALVRDRLTLLARIDRCHYWYYQDQLAAHTRCS